MTKEHQLPSSYEAFHTPILIAHLILYEKQEDSKIRPQAHSDYVLDYIDTYGHEVDIMVEAKHKELAVNKYKELYNVL